VQRTYTEIAELDHGRIQDLATVERSKNPTALRIRVMKISQWLTSIRLKPNETKTRVVWLSATR